MVTYLSEPFGTLGAVEHALKEKFSRFLVLGANSEAINECFAIISDDDEISFGVGVAVATRGVKPRVLILKNAATVIVGFDSYISAVPLVQPQSGAIVSQTMQLNGIFVDMVALENETVCVVHELGALLTSPDLTKLWGVTTDFISDWAIDKERNLLLLTEADSNATVSISLPTGEVLKP